MLSDRSAAYRHPNPLHLGCDGRLVPLRPLALHPQGLALRVRRWRGVPRRSRLQRSSRTPRARARRGRAGRCPVRNFRLQCAEHDDSPKKDRFSGFHHPVNFRSHLVSLRNRTKPTRTGACRPIPTVNCSIFAHLRSRHQKPHSIDCKCSGPHPYRCLPTRT